MSWFTFVCLSAIFLITPFQWGLYYESDFRLWEWMIAGLFVLNVIWYGYKKPEVLIKNKVYLLVLLLPLMYVLRIPYALNPQGNGDTIFRFFTYAFFFLLLIWTKESDGVKRLYPYVFHVVGISFLVFAVANILGIIHLDQFMIGCLPERSCGPVRYPNTFAAMMGAFWFYTFSILIHRKSFHWVDGLLLVLMLGYSAIFLHTYSRGAYIFFVATFVLAIILLYRHWKRLLLLLICSLILASAVFSLSTIGNQADSSILPDRFKNRVSDMSPSTSTARDRIYFYKLAIAMSKESPWTGFGGDSWTVYYPMFAQRVLGLNQVHNGYLDFLIEIGLVGVIIYISFFILLLFRIFKSSAVSQDKSHQIGVILALTMLFCHAMVDYDFSFGTEWLLIFWLFAIGKGKQGDGSLAS